MTAGDVTRAVVVIADGEGEAVLGRLVAAHLDLALVDAVAALQLEARRRGCSIRLHDVCPELAGLLDLVGLADLAACAGELPLEAKGQAKRLEQLGVQEVVEPGDPST